MGLTGDFGKLDQLAKALEAIGDKKRGLLKDLAQEALAKVGEGFETSTSPLGIPWAPLLLRQGQPLLDTGRLRSSITYALSDSGFSLGTAVAYAPVHQYGATIQAKSAKGLRWRAGGRWYGAKQVKVPARPFLPEGRVSADWEAEFRGIALEWMQALLKG